MKASVITSLFAAVVAAKPTLSGRQNTSATTTIAGIELIDTQIVRDARAIIEKMPSYVYKHQLRSWIFGGAILANDPTLAGQIDLEVHALSTLLHDLGWDQTPGSPYVSPTFRFEVDGANAARDFIRNHPSASEWDEARIQLVWDAIALHGTSSISLFKQRNVAFVTESIANDYVGPEFGATQEQLDTILAEFPNDDLIQGTNDTFIWFCETKPAATYETWVAYWGNAFVEGYSEVGHRQFDIIQAGAIP